LKFIQEKAKYEANQTPHSSRVTKNCGTARHPFPE